MRAFSRLREFLRRNWLRGLVHLGALWPIARIGWMYLRGRYWVAPVQEITTTTGRVALNLLVLSLACTPIRLLTGFRRVMRARRPLGLYAFGYVTLHLAVFAVWDYGLDLPLLWRALVDQQFVLPGFVAFLLLAVLAVTSIPALQRRMGRSWVRVQRLVYLAALLDILHFLWLSKAPGGPLRYGALVVVLLVLRLPPLAKGVRRVRRRLLRRKGGVEEDNVK
jgi:sulfoxide reductase heme-binding subunit YedZ